MIRENQIKISDIYKKIVKNSIGYVVAVGDGIASIRGLPNAMAGELISFEIAGNERIPGLILDLKENLIGAIILGPERLITEGTRVTGRGSLMSVSLGLNSFGKVLDGLGRDITQPDVVVQNESFQLVEATAPSIMDRTSVCEPLQTGIKAIDTLVPIGRGQRELILGDRQSGKTSIALDAIINQALTNFREGDLITESTIATTVWCIYVAIGQKRSDVLRSIEVLKSHNAMHYTSVIVATASDPASIQFLAPFVGMALGEYVRDVLNGHCLIVFDDLTKHAVSYRQLSLLLRRPPGREAYPGDVFYLHSRLLERASKLNKERGFGSITALPIIETQAGDVTSYIPTNVISITDGQIYLETELFYKGIRPAISAGLSVSRVGSAAQDKHMKKVAGSLKLELAQFREVAAFAKLGATLDETTQQQITRGYVLTEVLKQEEHAVLSAARQVLSIFAGISGKLDPSVIKDRFDFWHVERIPILINTAVAVDESFGMELLQTNLLPFISSAIENQTSTIDLNDSFASLLTSIDLLPEEALLVQWMGSSATETDMFEPFFVMLEDTFFEDPYNGYGPTDVVFHLQNLMDFVGKISLTTDIDSNDFYNDILMLADAPNGVTFLELLIELYWADWYKSQFIEQFGLIHTPFICSAKDTDFFKYMDELSEDGLDSEIVYTANSFPLCLTFDWDESEESDELDESDNESDDESNKLDNDSDSEEDKPPSEKKKPNFMGLSPPPKVIRGFIRIS